MADIAHHVPGPAPPEREIPPQHAHPTCGSATTSFSTRTPRQHRVLASALVFGWAGRTRRLPLLSHFVFSPSGDTDVIPI
jgi:hypothetical protein